MSLGTWWAVWRETLGHPQGLQSVCPGRGAGWPTGGRAGSSCVHTLDAGWEVWWGDKRLPL